MNLTLELNSFRKESYPCIMWKAPYPYWLNACSMLIKTCSIHSRNVTINNKSNSKLHRYLPTICTKRVFPCIYYWINIFYPCIQWWCFQAVIVKPQLFKEIETRARYQQLNFLLACTCTYMHGVPNEVVFHKNIYQKVTNVLKNIHFVCMTLLQCEENWSFCK